MHFSQTTVRIASASVPLAPFASQSARKTNAQMARDGGYDDVKTTNLRRGLWTCQVELSPARTEQIVPALRVTTSPDRKVTVASPAAMKRDSSYSNCHLNVDGSTSNSTDLCVVVRAP